MKKAFSLLELIIVILIIAIILSFATLKFDTIFYNSNLTKLKSDFALIQNGISNLKRKNILLLEDDKISSLDDAISSKDKERLFTKVVDFSIISTDDSLKQKGMWLKKNSTSYEFFLASNKKITFKLKDSVFICDKPQDICKELH